MLDAQCTFVNICQESNELNELRMHALFVLKLYLPYLL